MPLFRLIPFAQEPRVAGLTLHGSVELDGSVVRAEYVLTGELTALVIPASASPRERCDGLWRNTCFELFIAPCEQQDYLEINVSPSGNWNAYRFTGYREGMASLAVTRLTSRCAHDQEALRIGFEIEVGETSCIAAPCELAVTAVIEHSDGARSYWALAHKNDRPDFHRRDSFVMRADAQSL